MASRRFITTASKVSKLLREGNVFSEFTLLANEYNATNLGQGFPSFGSPKFLFDPTIASGDIYTSEGKPKDLNNQYSKPGEEIELAQTLSIKYSKQMNSAISPSNICTSCGAQEALFTTIATFCDPGDEVLMVTPAFDSYFKSASVLDLNVKTVSLDKMENNPNPDNITKANDYYLDVHKLEKAINNNTKLILLNTPSSPLGKVFSKKELEDISNVILNHENQNIVVLSDEVYEHMVYDDEEHFHIANVPNMFDKTVSIFSVGKTFSCTGWRIGYSIGPTHLINPIKALHAAINFSTSTPLQKSAARAFEAASKENYFDWLPNMLQHKRDLFCNGLREAGIDFILPSGGYFVVAKIDRKHFEMAGIDADKEIDPNALLSERPDVQFTRWLTTEVGVSMIPMSPFYTPENRDKANDYVRFAYCKDDDTLNLAIERLKKKFV
eukprot:g5732.t1